MAPVKKSDKKATLDAAAWIFNVVTSVGNLESSLLIKL
ncbi:unnamed protein product [Arabidopsis halleri]